MVSCLGCRQQELSDEEKFERASNELNRVSDKANTEKLLDRIEAVLDWDRFLRQGRDSDEALLLRSFHLLYLIRARLEISHENSSRQHDLGIRCLRIFCRQLRIDAVHPDSNYSERLEAKLDTACRFAQEHIELGGDDLVASVVGQVMSACSTGNPSRAKARHYAQDFSRHNEMAKKQQQAASRVTQAFEWARRSLKQLRSEVGDRRNKIDLTLDRTLGVTGARGEFSLEVSIALLKEGIETGNERLEKGAKSEILAFYRNPTRAKGMNRLDSLLELSQVSPDLAEKILRKPNWADYLIATDLSAYHLYKLQKACPSSPLSSAWEQVIQQPVFWKEVERELETSNRVARYVTRVVMSRRALGWMDRLPLTGLPVVAKIFGLTNSSSSSSSYASTSYSASSEEVNHRLTLLYRRFLRRITKNHYQKQCALRLCSRDSSFARFFAAAFVSLGNEITSLHGSGLLGVAEYLLWKKVAQEALPSIWEAIESISVKQLSVAGKAPALLRITEYARKNELSVYQHLKRTMRRQLRSPHFHQSKYLYERFKKEKYSVLFREVVTPRWFGSLDKDEAHRVLARLNKVRLLFSEEGLFDVIPSEYYTEWANETTQSGSAFSALLDLLEKGRARDRLPILLTIAENLPSDFPKKGARTLYSRLIRTAEKRHYPADEMERIYIFTKKHLGERERTYVGAVLNTPSYCSSGSSSYS